MASCAGYGWSAMSASGITSSKKMDVEDFSKKAQQRHHGEAGKSPPPPLPTLKFTGFSDDRSAKARAEDSKRDGRAPTRFGQTFGADAAVPSDSAGGQRTG